MPEGMPQAKDAMLLGSVEVVLSRNRRMRNACNKAANGGLVEHAQVA